MSWRRLVWLWAPVVVVGLGSCSSGPPPRPPAPKPEAGQIEELKRAEKLYRAHDEAFVSTRDRLAEDPRAAYWLTRMLVHDVVVAIDAREVSDDKFLESVLGGDQPLELEPMEHLRALGPRAVPAITDDLLRSRFGDRRQLGIDLLVAIGPTVLPALDTVAGDEDWHVRRAIVHVAGALVPDPAAVAMVDAATGDDSFAVRGTALGYLAQCGPQYAPRLREALTTDPDEFVRRAAAEQLGRFGDRATAVALVDYYEQSVDNGDRRSLEVADTSLRRISGLAGARDLSFWRAWLAGWNQREGH